MAQTTVKSSGPTVQPGEVSSIHIKPADNGFSVSVERRPPKRSGTSSKQPMGYYDYEERVSNKVFANEDSLIEFLREIAKEIIEKETPGKKS